MLGSRGCPLNRSSTLLQLRILYRLYTWSLGPNYTLFSYTSLASKNVRDFQMSSRNFMKQICFDTKCDTLQNFIFSKTRIDPREFRHVQCSKQFPSNLVLNISRLIPRPHVSGYFWIHNFFFPDTASVRRIRWMLHTNPQILNPLSRVEIFEYAVWIRNRVDIFYPGAGGGGGGSQDWAQFFTVNIQDGAERNVIASLLLGLQFQVLQRLCS